MAKIRVLVVDDKEKVRSMLAEQINASDDCTVVGQAQNGEDAIALTRQTNPDVVLMDIDMPKMDGIAATRAIIREHPQIRVLILTYLVDPSFVAAAMGCGAYGYIVRGADTAMIVHDIRSAYAGRLVIAPEFIELARRKLADLDGLHSSINQTNHTIDLSQLTRRETEVLNLIAAGYDNAAILAKLPIQKTTLEHHIEHIFEKIGVHSRTQAVVWARQRGLGAQLDDANDVQIGA